MKLQSLLMLFTLVLFASCEQGSNSSQSIALHVPQWLSDNSVPNDSLGSDKDHYFDRITGDVYEKENGSWNLVSNFKGDAGVQGQDGSRWISGSGVPSVSVGLENDLYLDVVTSDVFQKIGGSWTFQSNIKGVQGNAGVAGAAGANGLNGNDGVNGLSTIAGKTVQTSVPSADKTVLVFDQATNAWVAQKVDLLNTTGNLVGSRVSGDIAGKASSITGFIEMTQVNGLSAVLSALGSDISTMATSLLGLQTSVTDLQTNKANITDVNTQVAGAVSSASTDASAKLVLANSYSDTKKAEAIASAATDASAKLVLANSYADTKKAEAIASASTDASNKLATAQAYTDTKTTGLATSANLSALQTQVNGKADTSSLGSLATKSSVADADITGVAGSKVSGNIAGNAASITGSITESQVTGLSTSLNNKLSLSGGTMTGEIQLVDKTDGTYSALDKAKIWFNTNVIKFFDGSTIQTIANKDQVDAKADATALATTNTNVSGINTTLSGLGSLATKSSVADSDITGTISNAHLAGIDGSKVSGVIGGKIGDTVDAGSLVGFIDGLAKTLGSAISHVANIITDAITVNGDVTVTNAGNINVDTGNITATAGTITGNNIVATTSLKVGANNVLTTASTITSNKISDAGLASSVILSDASNKIPASYLPAFTSSSISDALSASVGASSAGKLIKTNANGYLDNTMLGLYYQTGMASTNGFLDKNGIRFDTSDLISSANFFTGLKIKALTTDFTQSATVDVQGQIVSRNVETSIPAVGGLVTVDFKQSNTMSYAFGSTGSPAASLALTGLVDGGSYTLVLKSVLSSGSLPTAFTASSVASGTSPLSSIVFKYNPSLAATVSGDAIYNFMVVRKVVYVTWMNGFL